MLGGIVPSLSVVLTGMGISLAVGALGGLVIALLLLLVLRKRPLVVLTSFPLVAIPFSVRFGATSGVELVGHRAPRRRPLVRSSTATACWWGSSRASSSTWWSRRPSTSAAWYGMPAAVYLLVVALSDVYGFRVSLGAGRPSRARSGPVERARSQCRPGNQPFATLVVTAALRTTGPMSPDSRSGESFV